MIYRDARQGLRRYPLAHGPLFEDYRRAVLAPFKYMIVYVTDGRSTDILAVLHAQRDPEALKADLATREQTKDFVRADLADAELVADLLVDRRQQAVADDTD